MSQDKWPPSLKRFVNDTFSACTPSNRPAVEAELKAAIFKAFTEETIWNIDWANFKLEALAKQGNNNKNKRKKYASDLSPLPPCVSFLSRCLIDRIQLSHPLPWAKSMTTSDQSERNGLSSIHQTRLQGIAFILVHLWARPYPHQSPNITQSVER